MTFDEFVATLDKKNQYRDSLATTFRDDFRDDNIIVERKGRDMVEVVQRCKDRKLYPVVDKRLGLVFGCETHGVPRCELYRYYYYAKGIETKPYVDPNDSQDRYISEGYGWFISSMRPRIIVAGAKYRPDQYDKDVFAAYQVDEQDLPRPSSLARFLR